MFNNLLPIIYGICVFILLLQALRVMSKGFQADPFSKSSDLKIKDGDRTGQVTIHPEILNQDGNITDEDLLTVRFSRDVDSQNSADSSSE